MKPKKDVIIRAMTRNLRKRAMYVATDLLTIISMLVLVLASVFGELDASVWILCFVAVLVVSRYSQSQYKRLRKQFQQLHDAMEEFYG